MFGGILRVQEGNPQYGVRWSLCFPFEPPRKIPFRCRYQEALVSTMVSFRSVNWISQPSTVSTWTQSKNSALNMGLNGNPTLWYPLSEVGPKLYFEPPRKKKKKQKTTLATRNSAPHSSKLNSAKSRPELVNCNISWITGVLCTT